MDTITVQSSLRTRNILSSKRVQEIVRHVLKREKERGGVSIEIIGTKKMRSLNAMHRGVDRPTDVLSFGMGEQWGEERELGDIFVCQPYIIAQAARFEVSTREEMTRMMVHGVLHLLGYDHETDAEAKEMFGKQERYLKQLTA